MAKKPTIPQMFSLRARAFRLQRVGVSYALLDDIHANLSRLGEKEQAAETFSVLLERLEFSELIRQEQEENTETVHAFTTRVLKPLLAYLQETGALDIPALVKHYAEVEKEVNLSNLSLLQGRRDFYLLLKKSAPKPG